MAQLHQILAALQTLKGSAGKALGALQGVFKNKEHLFKGHVKTFKALNEDDMEIKIRARAEFESQKDMASTVGAHLRAFQDQYAPLIDAQVQIDKTNMGALALLMIDGDEYELPSTFLMQLGHTLQDLKEMYESMPTLDPKLPWERHTDAGKGVWKSGPEETIKTQKTTEYKTVVQATPEHPAQAITHVEDKLVGTIETMNFSGQITVQEKDLLLGRLTYLVVAVKKAISEANEADHDTSQIGKAVLEFIHGDLV